MQHLPRPQLLAVKFELQRADAALARIRGIFISAGAAKDAASINGLIERLNRIRKEIDNALLAKP